MVAHKNKRVKSEEESARANPYSWTHEPWQALLWWIDCHPRVGWFWALLLIVNTILNILDLAGFGSR